MAFVLGSISKEQEILKNQAEVTQKYLPFFFWLQKGLSIVLQRTQDILLILCFTCNKVTNNIEGLQQGFLAKWWLKPCLLDAGPRAEECPPYKGLSNNTVIWNNLHYPLLPSLNTPQPNPPNPWSFHNCRCFFGASLVSLLQLPQKQNPVQSLKSTFKVLVGQHVPSRPYVKAKAVSVYCDVPLGPLSPTLLFSLQLSEWIKPKSFNFKSGF